MFSIPNTLEFNSSLIKHKTKRKKYLNKFANDYSKKCTKDPIVYGSLLAAIGKCSAQTVSHDVMLKSSAE
jgi:hypothetical protein